MLLGFGGPTYPERSTVGQTDWDVGEDGQQTVGHSRPEGEVVGDLVDGEEEVLVRGGSDHVCSCEKFPVEHGGVAEQVGAEDLEGDNAENDIFGQGLWSAELGNLKEAQMSINDYLAEKATEKYVHTSGCALMMACRLERCGSSVYVQKK